MKEKGNLAYDKAFAFAKNMVNLYKKLTGEQREFVLSKQLLRSGTSIGANLAEAIGAFTKADFSYKISISYKECLETKYWLSLLHETNYLTENSFSKYYANADEIGKILFATLKTTKLKS
ncbi:MAG: four helix bundle protein [Bacteroidetes bacterium]|nr:four helix bundle protein [Bacteroidota bacterium]